MKKPTKADFLLLALLLLAALAALLLPRMQKSEQLIAEIYEDGRPVRTVVLSALTKEETITVGRVTLIAAKTGIRFVNAPCPDQHCVRYGMLTRPGETMACVPEKIVVRLRGGTADGVTG